MRSEALTLPSIEISPLSFHIKLQEGVSKYQIPLPTSATLVVEAKAKTLLRVIALDEDGEQLAVAALPQREAMLKKPVVIASADNCVEVVVYLPDPDGPLPDSTKAYRGIVCG